nr:MAG TPA: hypothetical protein [Bacteriophage sp.]
MLNLFFYFVDYKAFPYHNYPFLGYNFSYKYLF